MIPLLFEEKKLKIPDLNKKYANNSGNREETKQFQKPLLFAEKFFVNGSKQFLKK